MVVTLHRQLVVLVSFLWLALLTGVFWLSVHNARDMLERQLHVHAQDTANSLGLSIAHPLGAQDKVLVESMIGAIYDSGYYREIALRNPAGDLLVVQRENRVSQLAPTWFVQALSIDPTPGLSEITHEWRVIGKLTVLPDTQQAYTELWKSTLHALWLFLAVGAFSLLLLWAIVRAALRPLRDLESQAEAICHRDFTGQQPLPRTRELRRVVQAMNRMTRQLKTLFDEQVAQIEQVRNQAYIDGITGLGNGRFFNAQLQSRLDSIEEPFVGALIKLEIGDMSAYNQQFGHDAGNWLLKQAGKLWRQQMDSVENAVFARVTGARFAAMLPHVEQDQVRALVQNFLDQLQALEPFSQTQTPLAAYAGIALCEVGRDLQAERPKALEAQADNALQKAQAGDAHCVQVFDPHGEHTPQEDRPHGVDDWESFLRDVIEQRRFTFHYQPVVSCLDQSLLHYEVLARIKLKDQVLAAGLFMPLVERFRLVQAFDQAIVSLLVEQLLRKPAEQRIAVAVNLSSHSVREEHFVDWLLDYLAQHSEATRYLIFEVPEVSVRTAHGRLKTLAEGLKRLGTRLAIDHFGSTNSSFGYLSGLPLYSIKVDQSYIRDIGDNLDNQFFVQSLVRIAHSRQILLTAEMVENVGQWELLRRFQVDGAQGFFLGKPAEINLLSA